MHTTPTMSLHYLVKHENQQYHTGVVCIPMTSKFLTQSTGEKIVKIGQYLVKTI